MALEIDPTRTRGRGPLRALFCRRNLVGAAAAGVASAGLGLGLLPAAGVGLVARWGWAHAEQKVPFTSRLHVILLPSAAEAALGATLYSKFLIEQHAKRTLLDKQHKDTLLVTAVAQKLIAALGQGRGGGYQKHLRSFRWEVAVVDQPVMNAFVFPGGKICVYTGLLDLLKRDETLLAMVMGHEIAHALARHSTEKMGFGLGISVALSILQVALGAGGGAGPDARRARAEEEMRRRVYMRQHSRLVHGDDDEEDEAGGGAHGHSSHGHGQAPPTAADFAGELLRAAAAAASGAAGAPAAAAPYGGGHNYPHVPRNYPAVPPPGARGGGGGYGGGGFPPGFPGGAGGAPELPRWMSDQMVASLTSVLLELPFSRRAETEADLIGLKLMALAGFDATRGPEAFKLLASASGGDRRRHAGAAELIAGLGCTHPDSNRRAEVLAKELEWMAAKGPKAGVDGVGTKVDYFAL